MYIIIQEKAKQAKSEQKALNISQGCNKNGPHPNDAAANTNTNAHRYLKCAHFENIKLL